MHAFQTTSVEILWFTDSLPILGNVVLKIRTKSTLRFVDSQNTACIISRSISLSNFSLRVSCFPPHPRPLSVSSLSFSLPFIISRALPVFPIVIRRWGVPQPLNAGPRISVPRCRLTCWLALTVLSLRASRAKPSFPSLSSPFPVGKLTIAFRTAGPSKTDAATRSGRQWQARGKIYTKKQMVALTVRLAKDESQKLTPRNHTETRAYSSSIFSDIVRARKKNEAINNNTLSSVICIQSSWEGMVLWKDL